MKKGWQIRKLGEVCEFIGGSQPPKSLFLKNNAPGYIRLIQIRDYKSDKNIVFIPKKEARRFCTSSDIMIGRYGPPVFQILRGLSGAYNVALMKAVPDESKLTKDYLFYFLKNPKIQNYVIGLSERAAGQSGLNKETLEPYPIMLPSLEEQDRIVKLLNDSLAGISSAQCNTKKNLKKLEELFKSYVQSLFRNKDSNWTITTVDKISTNVDSNRIPITKSDRKVGQYPYYGASGIVDYVEDYIFDGDFLLVSEDGPNLLMRSTPIAFSVKGKFWVNNHAHILKFENMATQRYVEFYLESIKLDDFITGAAQPKLNQKALNSISIPIPKLVDDQKKIVQRIETLKKETQQLSQIYKQKLSTLEELKKSLLHQAFSGAL